MPDLLTDTAVVLSVLATAAILLAVRVSAGPPPPAWPLWAVPTALGALATGVDLDHYLRFPSRRFHSWTLLLLVVAVAAVVAAARRLDPDPVPGADSGDQRSVPGAAGRRREEPPAGPPPPPRPRAPRLDPLGWTSVAAALGAFLCVPETGLLRALVGPVALTAGAASVGLVRSVSRAQAIGLATAVAWVALVDGQSRPASVVGVVAGLAGVVLLASFGSGPLRAGRLPTLATVLATTSAVGAARLGGVKTSARPAAATVAAILGPALAALLLLGWFQARRGRPGRTHL